MNRQREIAAIARSVLKDETVQEQVRVLVYEVGDLVKCAHKMERFPELASAYRAEAKKAIADLIIQLHLTCEYLGFDFEQLADLGLQAAKEAMPQIGR